jgi:CII-binding regulator of phage lambda lysogenization HflD
MSSRDKVQECVRRAKSEFSVDQKLNAIADAIHEFVAYIEVIEHQLRHVETRLRHMEMQ